MPTFANKQIIEHIERYQSAWHVHPFTCGNDSRHENLFPAEENNQVILKCKNCDYVQRWIPTMPPIECLSITPPFGDTDA